LGSCEEIGSSGEERDSRSPRRLRTAHGHHGSASLIYRRGPEPHSKRASRMSVGGLIGGVKTIVALLVNEFVSSQIKALHADGPGTSWAKCPARRFCRPSGFCRPSVRYPRAVGRHRWRATAAEDRATGHGHRPNCEIPRDRRLVDHRIDDLCQRWLHDALARKAWARNRRHPEDQVGSPWRRRSNTFQITPLNARSHRPPTYRSRAFHGIHDPSHRRRHRPDRSGSRGARRAGRRGGPRQS
jgi:hypothetical protein